MPTYANHYSDPTNPPQLNISRGFHSHWMASSRLTNNEQLKNSIHINKWLGDDQWLTKIRSTEDRQQTNSRSTADQQQMNSCPTCALQKGLGSASLSDHCHYMANVVIMYYMCYASPIYCMYSTWPRNWSVEILYCNYIIPESALRFFLFVCICLVLVLTKFQCPKAWTLCLRGF